jgi:hypothetical protein
MTDTAALVQEVKDNANRLGLTWQIIAASVADPLIPTVVFDSDALVIAAPAVSLIGVVAAGDRVMVMAVPPAGTYIIGGPPAMNGGRFGTANTNGAAGSGTTTSAAYATIPGSPTVVLPKAYVDSRIRVDFHATLFATATATVRFGVSLNGLPEGDVAQLFITPANTHLQVSGTAVFGFGFVGDVTIVGRWLRFAGAGTLTMNGDDWVSMTATEVT